MIHISDIIEKEIERITMIEESEDENEHEGFEDIIEVEITGSYSTNPVDGSTWAHQSAEDVQNDLKDWAEAINKAGKAGKEAGEKLREEFESFEYFSGFDEQRQQREQVNPDDYRWSGWSKFTPHHGGEEMSFFELTWDRRWTLGTSSEMAQKAIDLSIKEAKKVGLKYYEIWNDRKLGELKMRFFWKEPDRSQIFSGKVVTL